MEINSEKGWHFLKIFSLFKAGFRVFHFIIFVDLMCLVHSNPRGKLIVQFNNRFVLLYIPVDFLLFYLLIGIWTSWTEMAEWEKFSNKKKSDEKSWQE